MKRIFFCIFCASALTSFADQGSVSGASAPDSPETPIVTTLFSDGSTNTWTQADLVAALQLMNRKYHRDVETSSGRVAWHGKLDLQIIDTNNLVKIERYADGTEFVIPFEPPKPKTPSPNAIYNSRVPVRLAEARARRAAERETTNTVTVVVKPDEIAEE